MESADADELPYQRHSFSSDGVHRCSRTGRAWYTTLWTFARCVDAQTSNLCQHA